MRRKHGGWPTLCHPLALWRVAQPSRFFLTYDTAGAPPFALFCQGWGFHTVRRMQIQSRAAGRLVVARHGPEASLRAEGQVPGKQRNDSFLTP